jgi:hypothetical protein
MAGSLKLVARELAKCMLDLVGVQDVRWGKGDTGGGVLRRIFGPKKDEVTGV